MNGDMPLAIMQVPKGIVEGFADKVNRGTRFYVAHRFREEI